MKPPDLRAIYFYFDSCNQQCCHCWLGPGLAHVRNTKSSSHKTKMSLNTFRCCLDQGLALGLQHVKFTGGEPLCDGDFLEKLQAVRKRGLSASLETNGTLITATSARQIHHLGLQHLAVSLDGAEPASHDRQRGSAGSFMRTLRGLKTFAQAGLHPQVIFTPLRIDLDEVYRLLVLVAGVQVSSVKINVISSIGYGNDLIDAGDAPTTRDYLRLRDWLRSRRSPDVPYPILLDLPIAFNSIGEVSSGKKKTCDIKHILGLLGNGALSICGIGLVDDRLILGHAERDDLAELWRNHPLLRRIRTKIPGALRGVCGNCVFSEICLGSCRAEAFFKASSLTAPNPFCESALSRGIFPENRLRSSFEPVHQTIPTTHEDPI